MHIEITWLEHLACICKNQIVLHGNGTLFSGKYGFPKKMLHYNILHCPNCSKLELLLFSCFFEYVFLNDIIIYIFVGYIVIFQYLYVRCND
jgi:hypothetical protein